MVSLVRLNLVNRLSGGYPTGAATRSLAQQSSHDRDYERLLPNRRILPTTVCCWPLDGPLPLPGIEHSASFPAPTIPPLAFLQCERPKGRHGFTRGPPGHSYGELPTHQLPPTIDVCEKTSNKNEIHSDHPPGRLVRLYERYSIQGLVG
jgi:hypothetical protein